MKIMPISDSPMAPTGFGTNTRNIASIFAAAGHPNAVFEIDFENLKALTSGEIKEITE